MVRCLYLVPADPKPISPPFLLSLPHHTHIKQICLSWGFCWLCLSAYRPIALSRGGLPRASPVGSCQVVVHPAVRLAALEIFALNERLHLSFGRGKGILEREVRRDTPPGAAAFFGMHSSAHNNQSPTHTPTHPHPHTPSHIYINPIPPPPTLPPDPLLPTRRLMAAGWAEKRLASCLVTSAIRSLCASVRRLFMMRTIVASTRCRRSSSTDAGMAPSPAPPSDGSSPPSPAPPLTPAMASFIDTKGTLMRFSLLWWYWWWWLV